MQSTLLWACVGVRADVGLPVLLGMAVGDAVFVAVGVRAGVGLAVLLGGAVADGIAVCVADSVS